MNYLKYPRKNLYLALCFCFHYTNILCLGEVNFIQPDSLNRSLTKHLKPHSLFKKHLSVDKTCMDCKKAMEPKRSCSTDEECIQEYTPNFSVARSYNASIVHPPFCSNVESGNSDVLTKSTVFHTNDRKNFSGGGTCSCGEYCRSYSRTKDNLIFYFCGPCNRLGSECEYSSSCNMPAVCSDDMFCDCEHDGTFYDLFYCIIPYHGYDVALQLAIGSCILVALCLLLASVSTAIGIRIHRLRVLRHLLRREYSGHREGPPNDNPPKYEDVIDELPSYQEATSSS